MDTLGEYTDERTDLRTSLVPAEVLTRPKKDELALEPGRRHSTLEQIGIDRVVDAEVRPRVCRVTVAVERDQMPVLELRSEALRPLVRRGRVARRTHDHDRATAGCRDLLRSVVGRHRPIATGHRAPRQERTPRRRLGAQRARL